MGKFVHLPLPEAESDLDLVELENGFVQLSGYFHHRYVLSVAKAHNDTFVMGIAQGWMESHLRQMQPWARQIAETL